MFSDFFTDLFQLILTEIKEDTKIIKEILNFHGGSLIQSLSTNRQKRNLIKKMKRTTNYKQWKTLALSFDKLPGLPFSFFLFKNFVFKTSNFTRKTYFQDFMIMNIFKGFAMI